jgi:hypothetical protein
MEVKMSVLDLLAVTYGDTYSEPSTADTAAALGGLGLLLFIGLALYLISSFFLYKVFKKAGRPGWAGFVPVYNAWVLFEIAGKPGWWALLVIPSFIPVIGLLFSVAYFVLSLLAALELAKRFGKDQVFAIFGLWLFSIVGYAILAFDDSKYRVSGIPATSPGNNPNKTPEVFGNNNPNNKPPQKPPAPTN